MCYNFASNNIKFKNTSIKNAIVLSLNDKKTANAFGKKDKQVSI